MIATPIIMWDNRLQFFLLAVLGKGHKGRVGGSMALSNRGVVIRHWFSLHKQCNEWQCCHGREACWSDASGLTVIVQLRIPQLHFYFSFTFYEFKMATFQNLIPSFFALCHFLKLQCCFKSWQVHFSTKFQKTKVESRASSTVQLSSGLGMLVS